MARVERNQGGTIREAAQQPPRRHSVVILGLLFLALVLVIDGIAGDRGWLANRHARMEYEREQRALLQVRQRNEALREEIRRLKQDPAAIEELARRELGMMRPGEKLFIIRDVEKK